MGRAEPYFSLAAWFRQKHGTAVRKITVDAGFGCPNRDGTVGTGGCTFCNEESFTAARESLAGVGAQIEAAKAALARRGGRASIAVYFQNGSNTHGTVDALRAAYDAAACDSEIAAMFIGTRPDCLDAPRLNLIASYARRMEVWLEIGLQSSSDATLSRIRRRHSFADFQASCAAAAERGILVCAHVILGLPGESAADARRTAADLAALPVSGVKLHNLYVARGTPLEAEYIAGASKPPGMEEYASMAADFLERTRPDVVVHRLMSDPVPATLVAPKPYWGKQRFLDRLRGIFGERGTFQGALSGQGERISSPCSRTRRSGCRP